MGLVGPAIVLGVLTALRLPWLHAPLVTQDEGIIVLYAQQILDGRLPQRDFYTVYGPGTFALTAGAFAMLGSSLVVERLVGLALQSLVVLGVYRLALGRGRVFAVGASLLSVLCLTPLGLAAYAWVGGLCCIVWGIVLLQGRRRLVPAFALLALSAFFRPEMALPALAAGLPFLTSRAAWRSAVLGVATGSAPSVVFYVTWGGRAFDNVVLQRGLVNARMQIDGHIVVILCLAVATLLVLLLSAIRVGSAEAWSRVLLVALMLPQLVQRTDLDHLGYLMALGAPFVVLAGFGRPESASRWPSVIGRGALVVVLALLIVPSRLLVAPGPSAAYEVAGRSVEVPAEDVGAINELRRSVLHLVSPGARVFVGTQDMRMPSVTPVQLYFLFPELRTDAYYLEMPIGISTTVAEQMADDVRGSDVLLLSRFPRDLTERLFPNVPLGPSDADEAVRAGFCPAGGSADLRIMVRCATARNDGLVQ
ncbi:hypothetical protein GCM10028802_37410 [Terrabacter terrigena]